MAAMLDRVFESCYGHVYTCDIQVSTRSLTAMCAHGSGLNVREKKKRVQSDSSFLELVWLRVAICL